MQEEFACKGQLLQRIEKEAAAKGVVIEKAGREHYLEYNRRFVQALMGWLDNN